MIDLIVALRPDRLGHQVMDAHHQHIFIVRAIENAHFAALRHHFVNAPQVIVRRFFRRGSFEGGYFARLGTHAGHDMANRAVFPGCIHRLQHHQQRMLIFRVQHVLELVQVGEIFFELRQQFVIFLVPERFFGVVILQIYSLSRLHPQLVRQIHKSESSYSKWRRERCFVPCSPPSITRAGSTEQLKSQGRLMLGPAFCQRAVRAAGLTVRKGRDSEPGTAKNPARLTQSIRCKSPSRNGPAGFSAKPSGASRRKTSGRRNRESPTFQRNLMSELKSLCGNPVLVVVMSARIQPCS